MKLTYSKIFGWLYSLLLFLPPLIMYHRTSELFEFNKMLTIYLITGCVLSVWVARMLLERKFIFRLNPFVYILLSFLSTQIVSTVLSIDFTTSLYGYYGRFNGGLISILAYVLLAWAFITHVLVNDRLQLKQTIEKLLLVSIASSVVVMLWGLPSKFGYDLSCWAFTGQFNVDCWTEQFKPTIRVFSTLGQPNWLGAYLAIHFFIGLYFFVSKRVNMHTFLYGFYMASVFIGILLTKSRSALLAVGIALLFVGAYMVARRKVYFKSSKHRIPHIALGSIMFIAILFLGTGIQRVDSFIHLPSLLENKAAPEEGTQTETSGDAAASTQNITASEDIRKIVWQGAGALGLEYPLFGTGVETFAYAYSFFRPIEHNTTSEWDFVYNKAHNEFYNYFATTGFVGVLAYLAMIAMTLMYALHVFKGQVHSDYELLVVCLLAAYVTINITNFFGFSTSTIQIYFYLIPAWITLMIYRKRYKNFEDIVTVDKDYSAWLAIPGLVALLTLIFVVRYFAADTAYAAGEGLAGVQRHNEAIAEYYTAYSLRKEHVYADKISQSLTQLAFTQSYGVDSDVPAQCMDSDGSVNSCMNLAIKYNKVALEGSSRNHAYYRTQARNYFYFFQITKDEEDFEKSIAALRKAQELAPTDPRYPYYRALFELGKYESIKSPAKKDTQRLSVNGLGAAEFAIKLKPNYTDAYIAKGLMLKQLKDVVGAKATFTYVLENIDAGNAQAMQELEGL